MNITNEDNMKLMSRYEDNHFDLAIVDPPYAIGVHNQSRFGNNNDQKQWDNIRPTKEYFQELFRVSKNQIVWGGNYFIDMLKPSRCFIIWDKQNGSNDMADAELAWSTFTTSTRIYKCHIFTGIGCTKYKSIHPTQKPVKLYEWLLMNYATEGDKILDTHLGSGSIALACHNLGFDLTACELDKEYFDASVKRIKNHVAQIRMFQ